MVMMKMKMLMMMRCRKRIEDTLLSCLSSEVLVIGRRVGIRIALHVGAHAWEGRRTKLQGRYFSVEITLKLLEVAWTAVAAQGIDSLVSKLASIRGRVHIGLGSGQKLCIRSSWSDVVAGRETTRCCRSSTQQHAAARSNAATQQRSTHSQQVSTDTSTG